MKRRTHTHLRNAKINGTDATLSVTSKMPWFSWGIPTSHCRTGMKLAKVAGSVCSLCYCDGRGMYATPYVDRALQLRKRHLNQGYRRWADAIIATLQRLPPYLQKEKWEPHDHDPRPSFRWFDSGDLQCMSHLKAIIRIARECAGVRFMLFTKEHKLVSDWLKQGGVVPANLVLRLSSYMIDKAQHPKIGLPIATTHSDPSVFPDAYHCPALKQGNECKSCRACWDSTRQWISFQLH